MANLFGNHDGRPAHIRATLAYLTEIDGLDVSYKDNHYQADPQIFGWEGDRSYGYTITMWGKKFDTQINIIVASHPVGDHIQISVFETEFLGTPPTTERLLPEGHPILEEGTKFGFDVDFPHEKSYDAAEYIYNQLEQFWMRSAANVA